MLKEAMKANIKALEQKLIKGMSRLMKQKKRLVIY